MKSRSLTTLLLLVIATFLVADVLLRAFPGRPVPDTARAPAAPVDITGGRRPKVDVRGEVSPEPEADDHHGAHDEAHAAEAKGHHDEVRSQAPGAAKKAAPVPAQDEETVPTVPPRLTLAPRPKTPRPEESRVVSARNCFAHGPSPAHPERTLNMPVSRFHTCVLRRVCMSGGHIQLFDDKDHGSYEFPRTALLQSRWAEITGDRRAWEDAVRGDRVEKDTVVVMRHAYCCFHVTHFMEPLGALFSGLQDVDPAAVCAADDDGCVGRVKKVVMLSGTPSTQHFNHHMLKVSLGAAGAEAEITGHAPSQRCYDRMLVPGCEYGIWNHNSTGMPFGAGVRRYGKRLAIDAGKLQPGDTKPRKRLIVLAKRMSKRAVVDWEEYLKVVTEMADKVGAEVRTVQFGALSFVDQYLAAKDADVIISTHGADMTNMIFMKPGKVAIELNPLFFFEPRFKHMADSLGIFYNSWTCTAGSCAFGGDQGHFDSIVSQRNGGFSSYDHKTRTFHTSKWGPLVWPYEGYLGHACENCNNMMHASHLRHIFLSTLRDGNVRVGAHGDEIRQVLRTSFRHLKWVE